MNAISPSPAACDHVRTVARIETPLITDLVAAMAHLETAAERHDGPVAEARHGHVTEEGFSSWIRSSAARIRTALDRITAPYSEPRPAPAP
ncbi:hypothetical protein MHW47_06200 [Streptomyces sp. OfavH-34-F]|uniref:hypothetical protein n=1 Tax=Streptomyces sp. OfavH-34-F TaxID=2917760 RepID=UPI001EF16CF9|nr:hypothetical protein [Streptomyces sp. OfavH-34-F]MCG7524033.1 hypothetical protein [Streptomyces sp. OfavH-34-F]